MPFGKVLFDAFFKFPFYSSIKFSESDQEIMRCSAPIDILTTDFNPLTGNEHIKKNRRFDSYNSTINFVTGWLIRNVPTALIIGIPLVNGLKPIVKIFTGPTAL
jgi:hypothetical protein